MKTLSEYRERLKALNLPSIFFDAHGNPRQAILHSYIAGLIDGEGTIRIHTYVQPNRTSRSYSGSMSIGMVERKPVELVATMFGGSVREECVPNARSIWRWSQTGNEKVKNTLNVIRPYLIVKRQQAELVLELIDNWHIPHKRNDGVPIWEIQRRQDLYIKVRKLNAVGAAATTERKSIREDEATVCSVSKDAEDSRNDYPANLTLVNK